jgi:hypothetical protein
VELLLLLAVVAVAVWLLWGRRRLQVTRAVDVLQKIGGFTCDFWVVGTEGTGLGIDSRQRNIAFVSNSGDSRVYSFRDIIGVEICRNGVSFTRTNRGLQFVSAFAGQALFGTKGFLVGGTTASTTTSERIKTLSLKIYVNDLGNPAWDICFYRGAPLELDSRRFRRHLSEIDEWYGRIRAAMA